MWVPFCEAAHPREFSVNLFLAINSSLTDNFLGKTYAITRQLPDNYQTINRKITEKN